MLRKNHLGKDYLCIPTAENQYHLYDEKQHPTKAGDSALIYRAKYIIRNWPDTENYIHDEPEETKDVIKIEQVAKPEDLPSIVREGGLQAALSLNIKNTGFSDKQTHTYTTVMQDYGVNLREVFRQHESRQGNFDQKIEMILALLNELSLLENKGIIHPELKLEDIYYFMGKPMPKKTGLPDPDDEDILFREICRNEQRLKDEDNEKKGKVAIDQANAPLRIHVVGLRSAATLYGEEECKKEREKRLANEENSRSARMALAGIIIEILGGELPKPAAIASIFDDKPAEKTPVLSQESIAHALSTSCLPLAEDSTLLKAGITQLLCNLADIHLEQQPESQPEKQPELPEPQYKWQCSINSLLQATDSLLVKEGMVQLPDNRADIHSEQQQEQPSEKQPEKQPEQLPQQQYSIEYLLKFFLQIYWAYALASGNRPDKDHFDSMVKVEHQLTMGITLGEKFDLFVNTGAESIGEAISTPVDKTVEAFEDISEFAGRAKESLVGNWNSWSWVPDILKINTKSQADTQTIQNKPDVIPQLVNQSKAIITTPIVTNTTTVPTSTAAIMMATTVSTTTATSTTILEAASTKVISSPAKLCGPHSLCSKENCVKCVPLKKRRKERIRDGKLTLDDVAGMDFHDLTRKSMEAMQKPETKTEIDEAEKREKTYLQKQIDAQFNHTQKADKKMRAIAKLKSNLDSTRSTGIKEIFDVMAAKLPPLDKDCEIVFVESPPTLKSLDTLPMQSNAAYVWLDDGRLFYVNKIWEEVVEIETRKWQRERLNEIFQPSGENRILFYVNKIWEEVVEIETRKWQREGLNEIFQPSGENRILSTDELEEVKSTIGHTHRREMSPAEKKMRIQFFEEKIRAVQEITKDSLRPWGWFSILFNKMREGRNQYLYEYSAYLNTQSDNYDLLKDIHHVIDNYDTVKTYYEAELKVEERQRKRFQDERHKVLKYAAVDTTVPVKMQMEEAAQEVKTSDTFSFLWSWMDWLGTFTQDPVDQTNSLKGYLTGKSPDFSARINIVLSLLTELMAKEKKGHSVRLGLKLENIQVLATEPELKLNLIALSSDSFHDSVLPHKSLAIVIAEILGVDFSKFDMPEINDPNARCDFTNVFDNANLNLPGFYRIKENLVALLNGLTVDQYSDEYYNSRSALKYSDEYLLQFFSKIAAENQEMLKLKAQISPLVDFTRGMKELAHKTGEVLEDGAERVKESVTDSLEVGFGGRLEENDIYIPSPSSFGLHFAFHRPEPESKKPRPAKPKRERKPIEYTPEENAISELLRRDFHQLTADKIVELEKYEHEFEKDENEKDGRSKTKKKPWALNDEVVKQEQIRVAAEEKIKDTIEYQVNEILKYREALDDTYSTAIVEIFDALASSDEMEKKLAAAREIGQDRAEPRTVSRYIGAFFTLRPREPRNQYLYECFGSLDPRSDNRDTLDQVLHIMKNYKKVKHYAYTDMEKYMERYVEQRVKEKTGFIRKALR